MTKRAPIYLDGLDWMIHTMCRMTMRNTGGVGNASQIVLQLDGKMDAGSFAASVQAFAAELPVLNGRLSRDRFFRPIWRMPRNLSVPSIRVEVHEVADAAVFQTLETLVNTPFEPGEYVVFHLVYPSAGDCLLTMVFDHRLLDARGAEQFLLLLNRFIAGGTKPEELDAMPEPQNPEWRREIREGFASARCVGETVNRNVIGSGMIRVDEKGKARGNPGHFRLRTLNEDETRTWQKRVDRDAGYLMFMPYALASACNAFSQIKAVKGRGGSFIVPSTTDLRGTTFSWKNTFFNYCSLFFFKINTGLLSDRSELIAHLKTQFFNQTKAGFPQCFQRFMGLTRGVPIRLFQLMNRYNKASFSVGIVGSSLFEGGAFGGLGIKNLFHLPLIPPQVGIGFFFSQINGRLNMGVSWREGSLTEGDVNAVENALYEF
ncbi:hypothetical protein P4B35_05085 [Pontiellaceae bacterium B12227]|nr:hypothetical protein [Pontiellaceae bacterium B12227]